MFQFNKELNMAKQSITNKKYKLKSSAFFPSRPRPVAELDTCGGETGHFNHVPFFNQKSNFSYGFV